MLRRILAGSRYLVVIAVLGAFVAAVTVLIDGALTVVNVVIETITHGVFTSLGAKHLALECIDIIDLFLLGTTLYIVALGLYDLFIDDTLPMPSWLRFHSLDDLKEKLLGVVVVLLSVSFLGFIVTWDGSNSILSLGIAVGLVLLALGLLLSQVFKIPSQSHPLSIFEKDHDEKDRETTHVE